MTYCETSGEELGESGDTAELQIGCDLCDKSHVKACANHTTYATCVNNSAQYLSQKSCNTSLLKNKLE